MGLEKELLDIITPEEERLKALKKAIDDEKERIKEEERQRKAEALQNRVDALAKYNFNYTNLSELAEMKDEDFDALVLEKKEAFEEEEKARLEKEEAEKQQRIKDETNSLLINAKNLEDLEDFKTHIERNGLDFSVYESTFNQKKEMLEFEKKQADFQKQQDQLKADQEKLEREKKEKAEAEEKERIELPRS